MSNVALYARVSSEIQEKEATIESQVALLREAAQKQVDTVIGEYRDDGFSGDLLARPALDRLRDDAAKHLFEKVIILAPDRLSRQFAYGIVIADDLRKHGVSIQYLNQKDDGTEESKLLLGITGMFAQYEKAKFIERTRRGRLFKAKAGLIMTSLPPFGYTYVKRTMTAPGQLVIHPERASIVGLIFKLCVKEKLSVQKIREALHARGIHPPRRFTQAIYWAHSTLKRILKNETYSGIWHFNKNYSSQPMRKSGRASPVRKLLTSRRLRERSLWIAVPGIPAIIAPATFAAAQAQLKQNTVFSKRNTKFDYLLKGLCFCGECGKRWVGDPSHGVPYYRCTGPRLARPAPPPCHIPSIKATRLDGLVWESVRNAFQDPSVIVRNMAKTQVILAEGNDHEQENLAGLSIELGRLKVSESRLLEAYTAQAISVDQLKGQMDALRTRMQGIEAEIMASGRSSIPPPSPETIYTMVAKVSKGLAVLDDRFGERRKFIEMIIDQVVMNKGEAVIKGAIPDLANGRIVSPSLASYGLNPSYSFELAIAI